jgi:regulator of sigma E protease
VGLTTILAFAFVLGVLVFVHELGHFLAAKRVGIRVLKFQLGFNPTVVSFRRGDTEYAIGALPLGGYVKMAGENPDEPLTGRNDEFLSKTKWQRFQVLIMGPVMNLLLAFVLTAVVQYRGAEEPVYEDQPPVVGVVAAGSPAERAGIRPGDLILAVADNPVKRWDRFFLAIASRPDREVPIDLVRDGRTIRVSVTPATASAGQSRIEYGEIGVLPDVHPHLLQVNAGDPGARSGLKVGDVIVAVDGQPITLASQFRETIAKHPEQTMTVLIMRGNTPQTIAVTPGKKGKNGWLGVIPVEQTKSTKKTAREAISASFDNNVRDAGMIVQTLWGLVTRETSPRQLMGPIGIAQLSGETAQLGWIPLASLR